MTTDLSELKEGALADVCSLVTDGTHDTPQRVRLGYPLIKAKEIVGGRIDFETCDQISEEDHLVVVARSKPEFGDTLFAHIGASLGEAAFVNTTREFSIKNVALFKPNPAIIDPRYLYYLVISPAFQALAKGTKTGSAQPFLGLSQLRSHHIQYHRNIATQRQIASILSAYDELIENNQRRIKILEEMARSLYREWFVHFRFPGHEKVKMAPSSQGSIPQGWEMKKLVGITTFLSRGISPSYDDWGNSIVINQKCIRDRRLSLDLARRQRRPIPPDKLVRFGDVLINSTGVGTLGRVAQVYEDMEQCTVDSHVSIVRPDSDTDIDYFGCALLLKQEAFERLGVGATGQTELGRTSIGEVEIPIPPVALQKQFGALIRPMRMTVIMLTKQCENLRRTRDLLLPRLLSGKIPLSC